MNFYLWRFFLTIQHFVFSIFKTSRKALCFRNKKKTDDNTDDVPLNIVVIGNNKPQVPQQQNFANSQQNFVNPQQNFPPHQQNFAPQQPNFAPQDYQAQEEEQNNFEEWGSWDNQQQQAPQQQEEEEEVVEEEVDYFADMEPVVKIKKVFVKPKEKVTQEAIRMDESYILPPAELSEWKDEEEAGWDDDVINEEELIREDKERKMHERLMRHQERKEKRVVQGGRKVAKLAAKTQ